MAETTGETVAVFGATGNQGGAVVDALLNEGDRVRALVRDPRSEKAAALAELGVEVVRVDSADGESVLAGLEGVHTLFFMTTPDGPDGIDGESAQGIVIADAAAKAGVEHVVFSSVGGAERDSGVPHFESKRLVEKRLEELGVHATFIRPVFFMENFLQRGVTLEDGEIVVRKPLADGIPLQMISVRDIGVVAARVIRGHRLPEGAVEIAGDELTGSQIAEALGHYVGLPGRYEAIPVEALGPSDAAAMFRWFAELPAYDADFETTRELAPGLLDFTSWLEAVDWKIPS
ncbi:NmrA/HSCARG family protein [Herbiconiux sp. VKM Ac-1786]|uniref:NmrA/HSCARG family protein n=1 Tax=Herbiconiux sp. VKM Ac-1786 TaxID=2783824 RepID=UPI00188AF14C|nr:NmrA/HSCARG family protein [Herbiconiux sp. VKM Ac-1786]MBF4571804.1 NmrA/HSCARG family protein [Herbiconiux sp. VKM Ac-1786]